MTLDELNNLNSDANNHERIANRFGALAKRLAEIRNGDMPVLEAFNRVARYDRELGMEIEGVINEFGADLLRVAEMRLSARARGEQAMAKLKRDMVSSFVTPTEGL